MATHGSKSAKVRELLALGAPASDIARQVGCTLGLVYNVKARMGRGGTAERKPGRPTKSQSLSTGTFDYSTFLAGIRSSEEETQQLRATLERVAQMISNAL